MSNYWKKKMAELEKANSKKKNSDIAPVASSRSTGSSGYWQDRMVELEEENKRKKSQKKDVDQERLNRAIPKPTVKQDSAEDDIAPTKAERKWFQKGAFEDGYQFGDVTKTILGSGRDVGENIWTGVIGMGEKILDGAMMMGAAMNKSKMMEAANNEIVYNALTGKNNSAESTLANYQKAQEDVEKGAVAFVKQDLYDEEKVAKTILLSDTYKKVTGIDTETDSVFGEKSDALVQSAGQLAAQYGLSVVGVPWFVTSFATSYGSEAENALNQNASFDEANASALISAGAEVLSEKLFGGDVFSKGAATDIATSTIAKAISNKTVRYLANLGMDVAGEGVEEVVSQAISNLGTSLYKEENLGEILFSEDALDEYIESFIGGSVLGGGMSSINAITQHKQATKLTENEQKVVDKLVAERIAEAEEKGETLSKKEAKKQVISDMERGIISTDTIEEVLGGESYTAFKDNSDKLDALQAEYDELYNMKTGDKSDAQIEHQAQLKQQLEELKQTFDRTQARTKLNDEVFEMVKGDRLAESYNELARRHQAYQTDLSKYDAKQQAVIQKAIDSGVLNNSNRTHEFVDLVARISADKGVLFDFTNNKRLRESGFAMDGVVRNGFVSKDGVTLNVQAAKSLNKVVGHEITHVLEGTELYNTLQETVIEYAKSKGEYDSRLQAITELYNKHDPDADPVKELTADLVGDYLFTDTEFINNLSTNHRNVFQKMYDEVKYLCKVATAGSKEARQLEKVKKAFEDAYRADSKAKTETQNSITEAFTDSNGTHFDNAVLLDTDFFDGISPRNWGEKLQDEVNKRASTDPFILPIVDENGNTTLLQFANPNDTVRKNGGASHNVLDELSFTSDNISKLAVIHIDEIVSVSEENSPYFTNDNQHGWLDKNGWLHRNANVINQKNGNIYNLTVDIAKAADGRTILYATKGKIKKVGTVNVNSLKIKGSRQNSNFDGSLTQTDGSVNKQFSLSDSTGKELTKEQQEYFKDSKMRDDNGNLMVMYHGSQDAGFHVFDSSMSDDDTSFFFVDRNDVAASYSGTTETYEARTIRTAEDMNNFLAEIGYDQYEAVERNGKFELLENNEHVAWSDTAQGIYEEFCWYEGVGEGDANYKVYLNLKNPLEVDAKGRPWNKIDAEFSQDVYDRFRSLTAEEKEALHDLAEWEDFSLFNSEIQEAKGNELASAYAKMGEDVNIYDLFSAAADNFSEESLRENSRYYLKTRDYAQRAKEQGYDGVIFKNIVDNGGYSNGSEGASTVAIAFDSNQIKSVANNEPTADPDIRFSLSEDSQGRKLSENQAMYFEESKVVDENGKLKAVYHGSPADFNTFSLKYMGANGTAEGYGFYFTDKKSIAENYTRGREGQQTGETGNLFECYLDIKKPLSDTEVTMSRAQFKKFLTTLNRQVDADGEPLDILSNYGDVSWEGLNKVLNYAMEIEYDGSDNDVNLVSSIINGCGNMEVVLDVLRKTTGYDGIIVNEASWGGDQTIYLAFHPEQIKNVDNLNPTTNPDIRKSLSNVGETENPTGKYNVYGKDIALPSALEDIAPVSQAETAKTEQNVPIAEDVPVNVENSTNTEELFPDNLEPIDKEIDQLAQRFVDIENRLFAMAEAEQFGDEFNRLSEEWEAVKQRMNALEQEANAADADRLSTLDDADAPPEMEAPYQGESESAPVENPFWERDFDKVGNQKVKAYMYENPEVKTFFQEEALKLYGELNDTTKGERFFNDEVYYESGGEKGFSGVKRHTSKSIATMLDGWGMSYADIEKGLDAIIKDHGAENIAAAKKIEFMLNDRLLNGYDDFYTNRMVSPNQDYIRLLEEKQIMEYTEEARQSFWANADKYAPPADDDIAPSAVTEKNTATQPVEPVATEEVYNKKGVADGQLSFMPGAGVTEPLTRKALHQSIVDSVKTRFAEKGLDFDKVLKNAKNLSTFATVDNTPQRVMEKALGYKEGQILSELTVNKVAQNETESIKWLNSFTDRKNGLLAKISNQYHIKPGSKESAAAQMYAEGFYVDDKNNIVQYGDAELAADFKDAVTRARIKNLAKDPRIRQIYDETLAAINESRTRNAYPEIPRLDNYFLHFRAMEDTFSRLGLPFNPNDIRAKDLPTDLNGVTADLKPGQPYFASAMHRTGKRTSFDLLGGLEKYLTSAKNQIYHIDDIQTLRALRNYVADTYGQANGLEGLDALSEEEQQERIEKVYNAHLSTFAKFLNEEANILAGKTALIDRGLEGIIGRRGITFLDTINKQVGSNMVGLNVSSSLTNFLPVAQTFAKTNKVDFVKAFGQTVANKVGSIFGRSDSFTEDSPVVIRRKGAERFYRTPFQKAGDAGYVLMSAVDDAATELIARTKYNEYIRNGMDSQQAHYETDKWVSRLMGDRSLGQQPQLYNSKMLGLVTKFQLEVRNQLDSQFYDTIQEAKASNEEIENGLLRNAKTAAKVTSTFVQIAAIQHLFGIAFESIAGYNPAFDIIEVMIKTFGWDDEEEDEDTVLDNVEEGFLTLLEDLPYTSTLTGGRIPISSALPVTELIKGQDQYGNEKSRWETLGEIAPYYVLPGGYGQIKKTMQGLSMFSEDHPIAGSYTDNGDLRFPVDVTAGNVIQAGLFGQYASKNAREYFDQGRKPLNEKQIQEFMDVGMTIQDYWNYRDGLSGLKTLSEKADYIDSLNLTDEQKNVLINNIADRKEDIDMSTYDEYSDFEEFDFATKNPEKYDFFMENGISYDDYASADEDLKRTYTWAYDNPEKYQFIKDNGVTIEDYSRFTDEQKDAYSWAYKNPEKFTLSKAVTSDLFEYRTYTGELYDIRADKDASGEPISGSAKEKKKAYIFSLSDLDYGQKIILYRSMYDSKEDKEKYNYDIVDYLNSRDDISYDEMHIILSELGFEVDARGNISW